MFRLAPTPSFEAQVLLDVLREGVVDLRMTRNGLCAPCSWVEIQVVPRFVANENAPAGLREPADELTSLHTGFL